MLHQRFLDSGLSGISDYWLALQFGWKPLLSDIRNFVLTQRSAQDRIKQLLRDNGKPVRRRIQLLNTSTPGNPQEGEAWGQFGPSFSTYFYSGTPRFRSKYSDNDTVWASAQFKYWLPDGPRDINWRRRMMAAIFGLNPTPSVVYNAIPWTWLYDWFTNLGDVISNLDAGVADRLSADYFYVMRHTESVIESTVTIPLYHVGDIPFTATATTVQRVFSKSRATGDPFGFATNEHMLSGMQLSILGALGMSRLR
jgi:hypothetical protein